MAEAARRAALATFLFTCTVAACAQARAGQEFGQAGRHVDGPDGHGHAACRRTSVHACRKGRRTRFRSFTIRRFGAQLRSYFFNDRNQDQQHAQRGLGAGRFARATSPATWRTCSGSARSPTPRSACTARRTATARCCSSPGRNPTPCSARSTAKFKFSDELYGAIGRKEYNTPYLNGNDSRMTPNTFQGATLYGKAGGARWRAEWRYGGGYIKKIKPRNGDDFDWMSTEAGADVNRGVYGGGRQLREPRVFARRDQLPFARHHRYLLQRGQGRAAAGRARGN